MTMEEPPATENRPWRKQGGFRDKKVENLKKTIDFDTPLAYNDCIKPKKGMKMETIINLNECGRSINLDDVKCGKTTFTVKAATRKFGVRIDKNEVNTTVNVWRGGGQLDWSKGVKTFQVENNRTTLITKKVVLNAGKIADAQSAFITARRDFDLYNLCQ